MDIIPLDPLVHDHKRQQLERTRPCVHGIAMGRGRQGRASARPYGVAEVLQDDEGEPCCGSQLPRTASIFRPLPPPTVTPRGPRSTTHRLMEMSFLLVCHSFSPPTGTPSDGSRPFLPSTATPHDGDPRQDHDATSVSSTRTRMILRWIPPLRPRSSFPHPMTYGSEDEQISSSQPLLLPQRHQPTETSICSSLVLSLHPRQLHPSSPTQHDDTIWRRRALFSKTEWP